MIIYPAIDLLNGKCVRLSQGDFERTTEYSSDPLRVAESFIEEGATHLHVVDLDGAKTGERRNHQIIAQLTKLGLKLQVGGGVRSLDIAKTILDLGVDRVVAGSKLADDPTFAEPFFELGECAVAGIDAKNGIVLTHGWRETGGIEAVAFARTLADKGCRHAVVTDIDRDGMQTGPNLEFLGSFSEVPGLQVVQSGGIGNMQDLKRIYNSIIFNVEGIIIGRAIYEKSLTLSNAIEFFRKK